MRLTRLKLCWLLGIALGGAPSWAAESTTEPIHLRLLAFNDFHGHLEPAQLSLQVPDPQRPGSFFRMATGGAAALAGLVQALRAGAPHSLLISSGDLVGASPLVSALFRHESTVEAMNLAGVDVAVVGNHEFDAGQAELLRLQRGGCAPQAEADPVRSCALQPYTGMRFPLLAANVLTRDGSPLLAPYRVVQVGPVRVGVVGAVTRHTLQLVMPSGVAGLRFTAEAAAINRAVAELKQQGVRTVVVSVHEGAEWSPGGRPVSWNDTECLGWRGPLLAIAQKLHPEVDVVFSAHTHQGYNCRVGGRPVMQAVSYGRGLSVVDLHIDPHTGQVLPERTRAHNLPVVNAQTDPAQRAAVAEGLPADLGAALNRAQPHAEVQALVDRYTQAAAPSAQRVVGQLAGPVDRRGPADSAAGRLLAQSHWLATRDPDRGGSQFALMNAGGVRTDLACRTAPPCEVTYGDLFSMQPFGNTLVVLSLTGAQVKQLLEEQHRSSRDGPRFMSPSEGLSYRWSAQAPAGQRAQDIRVQGKALDPQAVYRVTVNSFMAEGGDGYTTLKAGRDRTGGPLDLEATLAMFKTGPVSVVPPRISLGP